MSEQFVNLSVLIGGDSQRALRRVMGRDGVSLTDAVGYLIRLGNEFDNFYFTEHASIEVTSPGGQTRDIDLLRMQGNRLTSERPEGG